jgi:hypothetical protein
MYALLSLVGKLVPNEAAPHVVELADGTTECVIQSLREAVLLVVGAVLFWVLAVGLSVFVVFRVRNGTDASAGLLPSWMGRALTVVLVLPFAAVAFAMIILGPSRDFRKVVVSHNEITFSSLYWSWSIPRSNVRDATIVVGESLVAGEKLVDLQLRVVTMDTREYRSVLVDSLEVNGFVHRRSEAELRKAVDVLTVPGQGTRVVN